MSSSGEPHRPVGGEPLDRLEEVLRANETWAGDLSHDSGRLPRKHTAVVTCMDTRIDPLALCGFVVGDVKVIRNAGGRASEDALRSLMLATQLLEVDLVLVIHHTNCALVGVDDHQVREQLSTSAGEQPDMPLLAMPDADEGLRADVEVIATHPGIPADVAVFGLRYDVESGRLTRVT